jgi:hypothetical protein
VVDWEWVDRRRQEGRSWREIAADPQSGFIVDGSRMAPGRQLRALSRTRGRGGPDAITPSGEREGRPRRWTIARVGWLLFSFFAPWTLLAYLLPSPIGVYLPAVPTLGFLSAIVGVLLAWGLFRTSKRWTPVFRQTASIGAAAGLVLAGILGSVAFSQGCPVLSPFATGEPGGWVRVPNGAWASAGSPVLFFFGSVACPYCSATSWAVLGALERLGNVSGIAYDHSSSTDAFPNTPSVVLPDLSVASSYVALDVRESTNDQRISTPATMQCIEQAYLSGYDPTGGIPFIVLGGTFVHTATLVDPGALAGLNGSAVQQQIAQHQGSAYTAISDGQAHLLAYLVWLDGGRPASVASDPSVAPILAGIH